MKLTELRTNWEQGHTTILTIPIKIGDYHKILTILKNRTGTYSLHRYIKIGDNWDISVDHQNTTIEKCLNTLNTDIDLTDLYNSIKDGI